MSSDLFSQLVDNYDHLFPHEKLVLQVISVVYEPTNQTTLKKILQALGGRNERYIGLDTVLDRSFKDRMQTRNLLEIKNGRLSCHSYISEWLTIETVAEGTYSDILKLALIFVPIRDEYGYRYSHFPADQIRRQLKYALFDEEDSRVFDLLDLDDPWGRPDPDLAPMLVELCANPVIEYWFETLRPEIRYQVFRPIFEQAIHGWSDRRRFFELLKDTLFGKDEEGETPAGLNSAHGNKSIAPLFELYYEQMLLRGEWQHLEEDLLNLGSLQSECLLGCLLFMRGDNSGSLARFDKFIARTRKATRKRRIAIHGFPGVVYLLALLKGQASGDQTDNAALAKQQINAIEKDSYVDLHGISMSTIQIIRDINDGSTSFERSVFNQPLTRYAPLETLLVSLALLWSNGSPDEALILKMHQISEKAEKAGYLWFAEQCQLVLIALGAIKQAERTLQGPGLLEVLPRMEGWERSLNALLKLSDSPVEKVKKPSGRSRLAWFLDESYGGVSFKAKEQKLKKNGTWSAGKAVSLKRLSEETASFPYITEKDRNLIQCIERERSTDYYGYGKFTYYLSSREAMLAAIGHPDIYSLKHSGTRIEFVEGSPELQVREEDGHLTISLEPYSDNDDCLVIQETPERYRIYQFSEEHLRIANILDFKGLEVPLSAKNKVLESISAIAPLLTVHSDVAGVTETQAEKVEADPRLFIHLQTHDAGLRLSFHVQPLAKGPVLHPGAGGASIFAEIDGKRLHTQRDLQAELDLMASVTNACPDLFEFMPGEWHWQETAAALEGLLALQSMGEKIVLTWPQGKKIKLGQPLSSSQMSVSLRQRTDWFELDGELNVDANTVYSMQNLLDLIKASDGRFIQLADGEFLTLTHELRKRLDDLNSYSNGGKVHALNAHNLEETIDGMSVDADASWDALKQRLKNARDLNPEVPRTLQADLRDYQLTGFQWLVRLAEWGAGACLADDMGLGKTVQSLAAILNRASQGPTLVLAPTSVCTNWLEEASRFAPTLNPIRFGEGDRKQTLANLEPFDLLICSYGLLQVESEALQEIQWNTIIADEAQAFKNPATKRSRAVMGLQGNFKMIATGTPIENHLGELWNLFGFINPGLLGTRADFNEKFALPIENQNDSHAREGLKNLISPFILRRLKRDVLKELPPRTDITLHVELSKEETALYEALRREAVDQVKESDLNPNQQRIQALASITRLRRAVCNPNMVIKGADMPSAKLHVLGSVLDELLANNHRALVFSQFVDHLSLIRAYLDERGISYQYLDGSTSTKKRSVAVNAFQSGESDLFLISLKAGGIGLNLTAADYVIHMDPWWNPAVEDQASDRAHRIGQQRPVTVYRLVVNNTIEEKIVRLHAQKRDLADSLLEGSEVSAKMSLDDVLALLS